MSATDFDFIRVNYDAPNEMFDSLYNENIKPPKRFNMERQHVDIEFAEPTLISEYQMNNKNNSEIIKKIFEYDTNYRKLKDLANSFSDRCAALVSEQTKLGFDYKNTRKFIDKLVVDLKKARKEQRVADADGLIKSITLTQMRLDILLAQLNNFDNLIEISIKSMSNIETKVCMNFIKRQMLLQALD